MNIFVEDLTLKKIEGILSEKLYNVKIIGDLPLSEDDFKYLAR